MSCERDEGEKRMTKRDITEENVKFIAEALGVSESKFWYMHDKGWDYYEYARYEQRAIICYEPSVNSDDREFREHEAKCITHKNLITMLKNALKHYESNSTVKLLHQEPVNPEKDTFYFKPSASWDLVIQRDRKKRVELAAEIAKRAKEIAYKKITGEEDNQCHQSKYSSYVDFRSMISSAENELRNLRTDYNKEVHRINNLSILESWDFYNSEEQRDAFKELEDSFERKKEEVRFLNAAKSDHFGTGIKKGEPNYKLYREYVKAKKQLDKELEVFPNRINAAIAELEANVPQDYETFVKETKERREEERLRLEKERLAEELRLEKERQAKLAREKKEREALLKQLEETGLGLGEKGKNGKEKRSFATRTEAHDECVRLIGKYKKLMKTYSKGFRIAGGYEIERWFITSQV